MDGANTSEMDIKVFIPMPTFCLQTKIVYCINGKVFYFSLVEGRRIKVQKARLKYENITSESKNDVKNVNIYHLRAHFIGLYINSSVFTL